MLIPDVAGNKLFHGYGNIETNPKVGLIFLIPGHNQTVRVNGKVKVIDGSELDDVKLEVHDPDEKAKVLQGLLLDVEESYSHCQERSGSPSSGTWKRSRKISRSRRCHPKNGDLDTAADVSGSESKLWSSLSPLRPAHSGKSVDSASSESHCSDSRIESQSDEPVSGNRGISM